MQSLCAVMMGNGINSSVSLQAYPNISPWSPAPPVPTPMVDISALARQVDRHSGTFSAVKPPAGSV
jgi:hypothetical protein